MGVDALWGAAIRQCCICLLSILLVLQSFGRIRGAGKLQDAGHVYQLADKRVRVSEVIDVVVLELEEGSSARLLVNDDWQDQAGIQLSRCIEVDLAKQAREICYRLGIALDLSPQAVDLLERDMNNKVRKGLLAEASGKLTWSCV